MGMLLLYKFLLLLVADELVYCATMPSHLKEEGHQIIKRFAEEQEFEGHDIAYVLHEKTPDTFHHINRRDLTSTVTPKDQTDFNSRIRLDLTNSRDTLRLKLKKRSIVDANTIFVSHKQHGRVKRSPPPMATDCYATGYEEQSPSEIAVVSVCDGLHGIVTSNGFDYYIHPVESDLADHEHQVHVLWKRSSGDLDDSPGRIFDIDDDDNDVEEESKKFDAWKTSTDFTIEFAMFTDARAWKRLQEIAPGREDEYMIVSMAAANSLYGDKEKVGYNAFFKVKLIEHWETDPEEYDFQQDLLNNLGSFCKYTRDEHKYPRYDMHVLHTGVTQQKGPASGMAFVAGVCKNSRCANSRSLAPNRHRLLAHEIGHNLGFLHHDASLCPDEIKNLGGSFMGGGDSLNFSPCNKWELEDLFSSGKGACLFEEVVGIAQPRVFPGQSKSPDKQCELYAGPGYKYFRPYALENDAVCQKFMCINDDKESPAYRSIIEMNALDGFPCGKESLCLGNKCTPWTGSTVFGWDVNHLKNLKQNPEWSSWPEKWSKCSSTCGTGVQTRERHCLIQEGPFVSPYCSGSDNVKARLCTKMPCEGEPESAEELRQTRGDQMCADYYDNGVPLDLKQEIPFVPKFMERKGNKHFSLSCFLSCERKDGKTIKIDGVLMDGTPCPADATRTPYDLQRFNIEMRCVNAKCLEFSDCKDNLPKDTCGECSNTEGYNVSRCVHEVYSDETAELGGGERFVLATIPIGSTGISVSGTSMKNGKFEMWSRDGLEKIWGKGGTFPKGKYLDDNVVEIAGTKWSLNNKEYARADGPLSEPIMLIWIVGSSSSKQVDVSYLLP